MRIALVGPADVRGLLGEGHEDAPAGLGGTPVVELARALLGRGHDVTLVSASPGLKTPWERTRGRLDVRVAPFRLRARDRAADLFRMEVRSMAALMPGPLDVDVAHAHWTYEFALAALRVHPGAVITAHDSPFTILRHQPHPYRMARLAMAAGVRSRTRSLTAVSPYLARQWRRQMLFRGAIAVVPNIAPVLARTHSAAATPTLITVGDASRRKNIWTLLAAFSRIRHALPDATLHVVGPGLGRNDAHGFGEQPGVTFHGVLGRSELGALLATSWLMVHPALEECQPMVLLEAMALGLPVVAGEASGGVPWTLGEGAAGRLVDVRDPAAIAAAALELIADPSGSAELGRRGEALIRQRFSPDVVASAYEHVYDKAGARA